MCDLVVRQIDTHEQCGHIGSAPAQPTCNSIRVCPIATFVCNLRMSEDNLCKSRNVMYIDANVLTGSRSGVKAPPNSFALYKNFSKSLAQTLKRHKVTASPTTIRSPMCSRFCICPKHQVDSPKTSLQIDTTTSVVGIHPDILTRAAHD